MATSVATPLERHLGLISDVTEMTSSSRVGTTNITLQFDLDRDIDGAARDVEAAINAARVDLPATLRTNPTYRKVNPADAPIMVLALTSETRTPGQIYDSASNIIAAAAQPGAGRRRRRGRRRLAAGGAGGAEPAGARALRHRPGGRARRAGLGQRQPAEGRHRRRRPAPAGLHQRRRHSGGRLRAAGDRLPQRLGGAPLRRRRGDRRRGGHPQPRGLRAQGERQADRLAGRRRAGQPPAGRQHHLHGRPGEGACCRR